MLQTLLAQKKDMRQVWTADGRRLVVTKLFVGGNVAVRTVDPNTNKIQIAFADKKLPNMARAQAAQFTKLGIKQGKRVFTETQATETVEAGRTFLVEEVFQAGDQVSLTGTSKGKGFAGVVKRWGFSGGPKTHGQSDRQRAPGSIGAGTTPGRVWKNKRMAGRHGNLTVTLENVTIVAINPVEQIIWIKGTIPGAYNSVVRLTKNGETQEIALNAMSEELLRGVTAAVAPTAVTAESSTPSAESTAEPIEPTEEPTEAPTTEPPSPSSSTESTDESNQESA